MARVECNNKQVMINDHDDELHDHERLRVHFSTPRRLTCSHTLFVFTSQQKYPVLLIAAMMSAPTRLTSLEKGGS